MLKCFHEDRHVQAGVAQGAQAPHGQLSLLNVNSERIAEALPRGELDLGFVLAMLASTGVPAIRPAGPVLVSVAKIGLTVTLFFIGARLSARVVKALVARTYVLGLLLWVVISTALLYGILHVG